MKKYKNMEFRELMCELVRLFEPATYVEIGVQKGYTFNSISPLVNCAVAVDVNPMDRIAELPHVQKFQMPSIEFAKKWNDPIDLLFIDADHRKESVLADFNALNSFVREGTGLIMLHDTHPIGEHLLSDRFCSNAWEAAEEIRRNVRYRDDFEIVTLPGPHAGLSVIRKAKRHLSWL